MLAAEAVFEAVVGDVEANQAMSYEVALKKSWVWDELYRVRNIRSSFKWGIWGGLIYSAIDTSVPEDRPWTLRHHEDHKMLKNASKAPKIAYPKPYRPDFFRPLVFCFHIQH